MVYRLWITTVLFGLTSLPALAQDRAPEKPPAGEKVEPVFSGPQVGEKLVPFRVRGVFDSRAGKELDFVTEAAGKPIVLVFVHDVNRPSIAMTRALTRYTVERARDGLHCGVVLLSDDPTEAENRLNQMRHALTPEAPTGVSLDGKEGPGSYGLNRNVTLTILIGKDHKVTGNFALVQPSLQADLPKILRAVVQVAGGRIPSVEELTAIEAMVDIRSLLGPVIRKDAAAEDVEKAMAQVEGVMKSNAAVRKDIGQRARTIVNSGNLGIYGTPRAQAALKKWAAEFEAESKRESGKEGAK